VPSSSPRLAQDSSSERRESSLYEEALRLLFHAGGPGTSRGSAREVEVLNRLNRLDILEQVRSAPAEFQH